MTHHTARQQKVPEKQGRLSQIAILYLNNKQISLLITLKEAGSTQMLKPKFPVGTLESNIEQKYQQKAQFLGTSKLPTFSVAEVSVYFLRVNEKIYRLPQGKLEVHLVELHHSTQVLPALCRR